MPLYYILPDPWLPTQWWRDMGTSTAALALNGGNGWSTANAAIVQPIYMPVAATIYSLSFSASNGTGNYDIGLYRGDLTKIQSSGSTAMSAAGRKTLTLTNDYRVDAGDVLFCALALSSTSGTLLTTTIAAADAASAGVGVQTSALPLPDPIVPVALSVSQRGWIPSLGIR